MKPAVITGSVAGLLGFGGQALTGGNYYTSVEPLPLPPLGPAELNYHTRDDLEKKDQSGVCANTYLNEEEKRLLNASRSVNSQEGGNIPNKFKYPEGKAEGCVAVSWNKETWSNNRGRGSIRYEWLYRIGDESLVVYGVYNPDNMLLRTSWRAIYINRKQKRSAWNLWFPEKGVIPKNPTFFQGKIWGFNPIWGLACNGPNNVCDGESKIKTSDEFKGTWKEDEEGEQLFTNGTVNFWDAFKDLIYDSANPLTELRNLAKREGVGTRR